MILEQENDRQKYNIWYEIKVMINKVKSHGVCILFFLHNKKVGTILTHSLALARLCFVFCTKNTCTSFLGGVVNLHTNKGWYWFIRWCQATLAVSRVDLAIGPLGMPHPGRIIANLRVGKYRFNKPSSGLIPAYTA